MPVTTAAPDTMPMEIAIPLALFFTVLYFIVRHRQNKKENS